MKEFSCFLGFVASTGCQKPKTANFLATKGIVKTKELKNNTQYQDLMLNTQTLQEINSVKVYIF